MPFKYEIAPAKAILSHQSWIEAACLHPHAKCKDSQAPPESLSKSKLMS